MADFFFKFLFISKVVFEIRDKDTLLLLIKVDLKWFRYVLLFLLVLYIVLLFFPNVLFLVLFFVHYLVILIVAFLEVISHIFSCIDFSHLLFLNL